MCLRHAATNLIYNEVKSAQNACKTVEIIISNILFQAMWLQV
jgi:hypothetical protein